ncbi:unnamed protein product [Staurois parvus]|uniref:Uncharacterized protein n=1 Tax=Staurois parvus TaxID=386267 RepID=A0ABN9FZJ1_9NEOB|nr:unnamed protein product [Staurois parvus]
MSCQSTPAWSHNGNGLITYWRQSLQLLICRERGPYEIPLVPFIGFFGCDLSVGKDTGAP